MSRAYDDVFSESLLDLHPNAALKIHVMRDPAFEPQGVALEVAPAGMPHVTIEDPATCGGVLVEWVLDSRSHLEPHEHMTLEPSERVPTADEMTRLIEGIGERTWHGTIRSTAVQPHDMNDEIRVLFDARRLPEGDHWRVAWPYDLVLVSPEREIEDRIENWLVIETL